MAPTMPQNLKWKFAKNQDGAIEGPNHPGIANFTGDRATAIIREAVQNSLDAREGDRPVSVTFERKTLDKSILATDGLMRHIEWSLESPFNDDENRPGFKNAKSLLGGGGEGNLHASVLRTAIQPEPLIRETIHRRGRL